jgi:hypothetical protein
MSLTRIMVEVGHPDQPQQPLQQPKYVSIEDKVRDALDCIELGVNSNVEWLMLSGLFRKLKEVENPNRRIQNLIHMIEPVMSKYGYHTGTGVKDGSQDNPIRK